MNDKTDVHQKQLIYQLHFASKEHNTMNILKIPKNIRL